MALNIVRLVALASLAVLGASFGAQPANAVSLESHHFVRHDHAARHHGLVAKRQASTRPRRCRARTSTLADGSSSAAGSSSTTAGTTSPATSARPTTTPAPAPAPTTTSRAQAPATTSKAATNNNNNNNNNNGGGGGGSGKTGIAYAGNVNVPAFIAGSRAVRYVYNWSPWKPEFMDSIPWVDYVPMFWGEKQAGDFDRLVKRGYARFALGMNEPNQEGQANISPQRGAQLWRQHLQPLKSQGYTLGSPAPTNAPSGKTWLRDFFNTCPDCSVDFIATHWYGTDAQQFIAHLQDYHGTFGRNIWVTEYACQDFSGRNQQCSGGQVSSFMQTTRNFMENTGYIQAYFYFGVLHDMNNVQYTNKLINGDSSPNTLGRTYIGY
ncbi:hypothetical protein H1R20_g12130, partial [Candolleomyces eurysporus]